jgi:hypothetical protein
MPTLPTDKSVGYFHSSALRGLIEYFLGKLQQSE